MDRLSSVREPGPQAGEHREAGRNSMSVRRAVSTSTSGCLGPVPLPGQEAGYRPAVEQLVVGSGCWWGSVSQWQRLSAGLPSFWWAGSNCPSLGQSTVWPESQVGAGSSPRSFSQVHEDEAGVGLAFLRRSEKKGRTQRDSPRPAFRKVRSGTGASLVRGLWV